MVKRVRMIDHITAQHVRRNFGKWVICNSIFVFILMTDHTSVLIVTRDLSKGVRLVLTIYLGIVAMISVGLEGNSFELA